MVEPDSSQPPTASSCQPRGRPASSTAPHTDVEPNIRNVVQQEMQAFSTNLAASIKAVVDSAVTNALTNLAPMPDPAQPPTPAPFVGPAVNSILPVAGTSTAIPNVANTSSYTHNSTQPSVLMSASHNALQARIPQKLKDKIWSHEFIDLSVLLDPDTEPEYQLAVTQTLQGNGVLDMVPRLSTR